MALAAPQMQVDLPGLTKIIMNLGSYGLKQFSMAGVDLHSVGCLLMIAEFVPASPAFRKTLNRAREEQRSERLWMYKVIEIGAASNFLAEHFLKTRAGENVLALYSVTASILDETACLTAINGLFEGAEVSPDNIPGTSQLKNIRSDLATLARKTGFRERVLQHHELLNRLLINPSKHVRGLTDPYCAIPPADQIPKIMRMLHKITTGDKEQVLIFSGLRGAAWVITYAVFVLDLHTSVNCYDQDPVPIYGPSESAKVLIQLSSKKSKFALYTAGGLQDLIETHDPPPPTSKGWSVDCTFCNFLELRHHGISRLSFHPRLSYFTALEALNRVSSIIMSFSLTGPDGFAMSFLPEVRARCLRILHFLGFRAGTLDQYKNEIEHDLPASEWTGHTTDPKAFFYEGKGTPWSVRIGMYDKAKDKRGQYAERGTIITSQYSGDALERLLLYLDVSREHLYIEGAPLQHPKEQGSDSIRAWSEAQQRSLGDSIADAAHFASTLAFTDWDSSIRTMSVRYMSHGRMPAQISSKTRNVLASNLCDALSLSTDAMELSMIETKLWSMDWMAMDVEEMVVIRNASQCQPLHRLSGKLLTFQTGRITLDGEKCHHVRADRSDLQYPESHTLPTHDWPHPSWVSEPPYKFHLNTLCTADKGTVFVRNEVYRDSRLYCVVDASRPSETIISKLQQVPSCPHDPNALSQLKPPLPDCVFMGGLSLGGLSFGANGLGDFSLYNESVVIYYQQTKGDFLAQWLACHWDSIAPESYMWLLRDSCIDCLWRNVLVPFVARMHARAGNLPNKKMHICIIDARPADGYRPSRSPSPATSHAVHLANSDNFQNLSLRPATDTSPEDPTRQQHSTMPSS